MDSPGLGIEFEQEAILVESAARKKEGELQKQKSNERKFTIRKKIIQEYFLRMCNYKKKEFLLKLLNSVRSTDSIMHIMNFMPIGYAKGYNYSSVDSNITFIYEKPVVDHDRMLDEKALEQTWASDLEWFRNLPDPNQVHLFIDLLRRGGGYGRRIITQPLVIIYLQRMKDRIRSSQQIADGRNKKVQIKSSTVETMDETNDDDDDQYDPTEPSSIEVEKLRKKWNDLVAKYRKEVEKEELKLESRFNKDQKKDEAAGKGKCGKGKKAEKSKASKKSSKKSGKGKKKVEEELDLIQSVPVWIVKKIFGYLDQKTLKKMKAVNSYWDYIIKDMIGEMKMRKKLDKAMEKLKNQIDPIKLEEALAVVPPPVGDEGKLWKSKRARNNYECEVTIKELMPKHTDNMVETSLITEVENEMFVEKECISLSNKPLLSFPRILRDDKLHKQVPCILRDVSVTLGLQDGTEKNISFLTYSLSSRMSSSIDFEVDAESMLEW